MANFILPPEGLDEAASPYLQSIQGLLEQIPLFNKLKSIDPAFLTSLGALAGPTPMLSNQDRLRALMESPLYFETPLTQRLAAFKGLQPDRSPELQELINQAKAYGASSHRLQNVVQKSEPGKALYPEGWVSRLIQGSGRR